jgi:hypothetical protein
MMFEDKGKTLGEKREKERQKDGNTAIECEIKTH